MDRSDLEKTHTGNHFAAGGDTPDWGRGWEAGGPRGPARGRLRRSLGGRGARRPAPAAPAGRERAGGRPGGSERGSGAGGARERAAPPSPQWFRLDSGRVRPGGLRPSGRRPRRLRGRPERLRGPGGCLLSIFFVSIIHLAPAGLLSPPTLLGYLVVLRASQAATELPESPRPAPLLPHKASESWGGAPGSCITSKNDSGIITLGWGVGRVGGGKDWKLKNDLAKQLGPG